jgi:hypothetical protein
MREGYRSRIRAGLTPGDERHGTANGYLNYGCRCDACRDAGAVYNSADARRERHLEHRQSPPGTGWVERQAAG